MINQKGIAHFFVLIIVLGGVVLGTYLIANRTNIVPNASEVSAPVSPRPFPSEAKKCISNEECDTGYECKTKDLKPLPVDVCPDNNPNCEATMSGKRESGTCHKIENGVAAPRGGMEESLKTNDKGNSRPSTKPPKPVSRPQ